MAYRNYSPFNGFTVDQLGNGDFTTITAAYAASISGQTIDVRPGTYTENPTCKAGVTLTAALGDSSTPTVTVIGEFTFSGAGICSINNINIQTNSTNLLAVSGSAASQVILNNCFLNMTNSTGISFTSSNAGAYISINNCSGNIGTTGIAVFSQTSPGALIFNLTSINNSGASSTANTISAGILVLTNSTFSNPTVSSGTAGLTIRESNIVTLSTNSICVTVGGSGGNQFSSSQFISGSASCISIGTGATLTALEELILNSNNTNAITGLGTLNYTPMDFANTSAAINPSVINRQKFGPQIWTDGITFDNSNVLANYAEGTWTPTIVGGSTAGATTYVAQTGQYTRIGRLVTCFFDIQFSAATGTGQAIIGNLPFTVKNATTPNFISIVAVQAVTLTAGYVTAFISPTINTTTATLGQSSNIAADVFAALNIWSAAAGRVTGTFMYNV